MPAGEQGFHLEGVHARVDRRDHLLRAPARFADLPERPDYQDKAEKGQLQAARFPRTAPGFDLGRGVHGRRIIIRLSPRPALKSPAGHEAWVAGRVKKEGGRKAVVIPSLGLAYEAETLQVR